jgi:hypothetical protein
MADLQLNLLQFSARNPAQLRGRATTVMGRDVRQASVFHLCFEHLPQDLLAHPPLHKPIGTLSVRPNLSGWERAIQFSIFDSEPTIYSLLQKRYEAEEQTEPSAD